MNRPTEALDVLKATHAATAKEWHCDNDEITAVVNIGGGIIVEDVWHEDAKFIVAAHTHIPTLLEYIEYLEERERSLDHLLGTTLMLVDAPPKFEVGMIVLQVIPVKVFHNQVYKRQVELISKEESADNTLWCVLIRSGDAKGHFTHVNECDLEIIPDE